MRVRQDSVMALSNARLAARGVFLGESALIYTLRATKELIRRIRNSASERGSSFKVAIVYEDSTSGF
jgi:hypothetical protein